MIYILIVLGIAVSVVCGYLYYKQEIELDDSTYLEGL